MILIKKCNTFYLIPSTEDVITVLGMECLTAKLKLSQEYLNHIMRNPAFCICQNKGADQLHGNRAADPCLYFGYIDITISLLPKWDNVTKSGFQVTSCPKTINKFMSLKDSGMLL